jgi:hypothetical protein
LNQSIQSITIFVIITAVVTIGLFFIFTTTTTSYQQTFAQETLTTKEALEQTFGEENDEESINQTSENGKTGFTMEDLYPEQDLAKDLANATTVSEDVKSVFKAYTEQSPEYKAKQALTIKYNELQEKYYLECIINKESGEFKNTTDCMTWSQNNAQIQLGLK